MEWSGHIIVRIRRGVLAEFVLFVDPTRFPLECELILGFLLHDEASFWDKVLRVELRWLRWLEHTTECFRFVEVSELQWRNKYRLLPVVALHHLWVGLHGCHFPFSPERLRIIEFVASLMSDSIAQDFQFVLEILFLCL